jgi:hypothetical protein
MKLLRNKNFISVISIIIGGLIVIGLWWLVLKVLFSLVSC